MEIQDTISTTLSIIALILTLVNLTFKKQKISNEIITSNRIEWIRSVRSLLAQFVEIYTTTPQDKQSLMIIKYKITLYFRKDVKSYNAVTNQIQKCIDLGSFNTKECDLLVEYAQKMLSEVWIRMKREAGISLNQDNKYSKLFNK